MKAANDNRTGRDFVYIVRSSSQNAFKVGYCNGNTRIHSLQTGNPDSLTLLRTIAAERQCEHTIHDALAAYRIRGEWFRDDGLAHVLMDELLDTLHAADECGRLMLPEEAAYATTEAIRYWLRVDEEDDDDEESA